MATSSVNSSGSNHIDSLLIGNKWGGSTGSGATVTFSFMTAAPSYASDDERKNFVAFDADQIASTRQALQLWREVSGINFVEVSDVNAGGEIRFGASTTVGSYAYYPGDSAGGDIWLRGSTSDLHTVLHEIGHAIGLKHPGNVDSGGNLPPPPFLPTATDNNQYSVMAYPGHPGTDTAPQSPMLYDIAAIQYAYGANRNTRTGNDVYSWKTSTAFTQTIWDAGGIDTITAANQNIPVTINLKAGAFSSIGPRSNGSSTPATNNLAIAYAVAGIDSTIENAFGGTGNDKIYGNSADNVLRGNIGGDYIDGWEGDDTLYGGTSTNFINTGNDVLVAWKGNDRLYGGDGDDWLDGSYDNDFLYGGDGNDTLGNSVVPEPGDDFMDGENGNDMVYGGDGVDTLYGGYSFDTLYGGAGNDYMNGGGVSFFDSSSDKLYGEAGNDYLLGGNGTDYLDGGSGADTMYGHYGNDTYVVDNALDVINETSGTGIETVISSIGFSLGADSKGLDHLTLTENAGVSIGIGNSWTNTLKGNNYRNTLDGRVGTDTLDGRGGNDILVGGAGTDTLTGGTGQDIFVSQSKSEGSDRITDFSVVDDVLNVSKAGFGSGLNVGTLLTSQFVLGSSATNRSQRFIYDRSNGGLSFDADGNGATAKIQIASLSTGLSLTNNDIYVIG